MRLLSFFCCCLLLPVTGCDESEPARSDGSLSGDWFARGHVRLHDVLRLEESGVYAADVSGIDGFFTVEAGAYAAVTTGHQTYRVSIERTSPVDPSYSLPSPLTARLIDGGETLRLVGPGGTEYRYQRGDSD